MDLNLIDLWERPAEVAKWLNLIPSALQERNSPNNPPSLQFSLDVDDHTPGPPNLGSACHSPQRRRKKSPHQKQVVDTKSHTTNNITIMLIKIQSMVPVNYGNKRLYPTKVTRKLKLGATTTKTTTTLGEDAGRDQRE